MSEVVTNDMNKKTVIGLKVDDYEHKIPKQYADIFYNRMIEDRVTKEHLHLSEKLNIGELIRNAIYAYLMQYQYIMQNQKEQKQQAIR